MGGDKKAISTEMRKLKRGRSSNKGCSCGPFVDTGKDSEMCRREEEAVTNVLRKQVRIGMCVLQEQQR